MRFVDTRSMHAGSRRLHSLFALLIGLAWNTGVTAHLQASKRDYHSPFSVAFSPDGSLLAATDRTGAAVVIIDPTDGRVRRTVALHGEPMGVIWSSSGSDLFVAEYIAGTVAQVNAKSGKIVRRLATGPRPVGLALASRRQLLLVTNTGTDRVSVIDLQTGRQRAQIAVPRQAYFVALTPDESWAVVGNLLPAGPANDPQTSASVSLIHLEQCDRVVDIRLPPGSTVVRGIATSPDGQWA